LRASDDRGLLDKPGGVFLRKAPQIPQEDQVLLQAAARTVLLARHGSLASQLARFEHLASPYLPPSRFAPGRPDPGGRAAEVQAGPPADLLFANGVGRFTPTGREYCIDLPAG